MLKAVGPGVLALVCGLVGGHHFLHAAETTTIPGVSSPGQVTASSTLESAHVMLQRYCVTCHNSTLLTAGLSLDSLDVARVGEHPESWERVVRKLRTGAIYALGRTVAPRPGHLFGGGDVARDVT